jgi:hypothetical protein
MNEKIIAVGDALPIIAIGPFVSIQDATAWFEARGYEKKDVLGDISYEFANHPHLPHGMASTYTIGTLRDSD